MTSPTQRPTTRPGGQKLEDPFGLVGKIIGSQFRVDRLVGKEDFTIVYQGTHLALKSKVAIKCLYLPDTTEPSLVEHFELRFSRGSALHSKLAQGSRHIVRAVEAGSEVSPKTRRPVQYLVLEWLEGRTLHQDFASRRANGGTGRSFEEALQLFESVALALAYAHSQGITHHHLNPHTLFLVHPSEGNTLKILDFGLASLATEPQSAQAAVTAGEFHLHHPEYAAPEQLDPTLGATGPWSDVYSFAVVILEALRDRPVVTSGDAASCVQQVLDPLNRPKPRLLGLTSIPADLEVVFSAAVDLDISIRPKDAAQFWKALGRGAPPRARSSSTIRQATFLGTGAPGNEGPPVTPTTVRNPENPEEPQNLGNLQTERDFTPYGVSHLQALVARSAQPPPPLEEPMIQSVRSPDSSDEEPTLIMDTGPFNRPVDTAKTSPEGFVVVAPDNPMLQDRGPALPDVSSSTTPSTLPFAQTAVMQLDNPVPILALPTSRSRSSKTIALMVAGGVLAAVGATLLGLLLVGTRSKPPEQSEPAAKTDIQPPAPVPTTHDPPVPVPAPEPVPVPPPLPPQAPPVAAAPTNNPPSAVPDPFEADEPAFSPSRQPPKRQFPLPKKSPPLAVHPHVSPTPPQAAAAPPARRRKVVSFNATAAHAQLSIIEGILASCKRSGGVTGAGKIRVTFVPDGTVSEAVISQAPFVNTREGTCVETRFRATKIDPYDGDPVSVDYTFHIPN